MKEEIMLTRQEILELEHELIGENSAWENLSNKDDTRMVFYNEGIYTAIEHILDLFKE